MYTDILPTRSNPLRFGIMCTGTTFPAWEADCIRKLVATGIAIPALLIIDSRKPGLDSAARETGFNKLSSLFRHTALTMSKTMKAVDMTMELEHVAKITCSVQVDGRHPGPAGESDVRQIRKFNLDFILKFGSYTVTDHVLSLPKYGLWSFRHGDETKYCGSPPAFWEICDGNPTTRATLQRIINQSDAGIVMKQGSFPTTNHSYKSSLNRVLTDIAAWPAQVCLDIEHGSARYLEPRRPSAKVPNRKDPSNLQIIIMILKTWRNLAAKFFRLILRHEEWAIGIANAPITAFVNAKTLPEIHWLPIRARGHYVADPFGFVDDNETIILCEEYDYWRSHGVISKYSGQDVESIAYRGNVFDTAHHLSYPFLFWDERELYCIPESSEARHVKLYKATPSVSSWEEAATLLSNFAAADSTVVNHDGRWWLFCTNADDGRQDKLFIWHSETLLGPWQPHMCNPVKIDVRSARPAGTPFHFDGDLYRPAQNCSITYGGRISLNKVTRLTTTTFEETVCNVIGPAVDGKYTDGMHTLSRFGEEMTLVDGKRYRFFTGGFFHALKLGLRSPFSKKGNA
jgi:hypothetical protein